MAIRRWLVEPDTVKDTQTYGPLAVVSREAFVDAVLDAVSLVDRSGGGFTVFSSRHPTDVEHEMVTTAVMIEWRDRTDAKPQPERPSAPVQAPPIDLDDPANAHIASQVGRAPVREGVDPQIAENLEVITDAAAADGSPDGLDEAALEEEDLSEVPEGAR
jgi:hypothetical protein